MLKGFKIVNIFLEIAQTVFHGVSIFAVNYGVSFKNLGGNGLVVCREDVGNIVIKSGFDFLLISQLVNDSLNAIHTADEIALSEIKIALIVNGS